MTFHGIKYLNTEKSSEFSLNMLTQFQTLLNIVARNSSLEWLHSKYLMVFKLTGELLTI